MSHEPTVVNFAQNQGTYCFCHIENFYNFEIDLVEKVTGSKNQEISNLKAVIKGLIKDKQDLVDLIKAKK